jgi:putative FmdB family regulatory protein
MPIYAFECASCGHQFERLQRLADADPTECPECHAAQVRRQLTAPSFRLAGAGWYETDFKKDGDKKRNLVDKRESASEGSATPASETKVEAKPEAKPEAKVAAKSEPKAPANISGSRIGPGNPD